DAEILSAQFRTDSTANSLKVGDWNWSSESICILYHHTIPAGRRAECAIITFVDSDLATLGQFHFKPRRTATSRVRCSRRLPRQCLHACRAYCDHVCERQ